MTVLEYLERRKIDDKKQIRLPGPYLRAGITSNQAGGKIMRRYFELIGKRQVAQLSIVDGSPAEKAPSDKFEECFNCEVREIGRIEYERLAEEYTK
jgi:hypothetical protein|nr:MAG TPA: hypothetical protein [Caudoviricetes sp.]